MLLLSHFNEYDLKFDLIARFLVPLFLLKSYFADVNMNHFIY